MYVTQLSAGITPRNVLRVWGTTLISAEAKSVGSRSRILVVETSLSEKAYKRFKVLISYNVLQSDIEGTEDPDPQVCQGRTHLNDMSWSPRLQGTLRERKVLAVRINH